MSAFNPRPICPIPIQFDVSSRVDELLAMISDPAISEAQKENLRAAIELYAQGVFPGPLKLIQDGKIVELRDLDVRRAWWAEGYAQQLSSQHIVPGPSSGISSEGAMTQQLAHRITYGRWQGGVAEGHQMFARIRAIPGLAPPRTIDVTMLNDTGSTAHTIFDTDVIALGIPANYAGYGPLVQLATANGPVYRRYIAIQIQLLDPNGIPASDWMDEDGVVTPLTPGAVALSGNGIRRALYFATAPGNDQLYVAVKKNGLVKQLPTV
ncbi:hypothetical protein FQN50_001106 [Emmonsiellopsis sp. PD_5]|nr:hypothetical protein FQN50_001106 [Emmonsiellopsis sp. PD_5]